MSDAIANPGVDVNPWQNPTNVSGTVELRQPPRRRPNADKRAREYLTDAEVQKLMKAAGDHRNGHRDATMVLLTYRHGHLRIG